MSQNKNRLELRLDPDSQNLLDSLKIRTGLTKTSIIKKALVVYASALKNGHIYTVRLKANEQNSQFDDNNDEDLEENIRLAKINAYEDI